jgi:hypothetical protein
MIRGCTVLLDTPLNVVTAAETPMLIGIAIITLSLVIAVYAVAVWNDARPAE